MTSYNFEADIWEWSGKGSWHFMTIPEDLSGIIRMSRQKRTGFGSIRVLAEISGIEWKTSLFPDSKSGCYLLPVKSAVRTKGSLKSGSKYSVSLSVFDCPVSKRTAP